MARPRVFISSTYYDLKSVREDLDRFISSMGYEPVRHERGHISYGKEGRPEEFAYREIESCDILVSIVGGTFGSQASGTDYSISQQELKRAVELGTQIYIFVEKSVHSEYAYYKANKDVPGVRYTAVNDIRVYSFLDELFALPRGNPIFAFDTGLELTNILREQWAGLLQRLLSQDAARAQTSLTEELQRSLQTVGQLVEFLKAENDRGGEAIKEILFSNHPIFEAVRAVTKSKYRVYFTSLNEFNDWLRFGRSYDEVDEKHWDSPEFAEWSRDIPGRLEYQLLFVKRDLFDADGKLKSMSIADWDDSWVRIERRHRPTSSPGDFTDEIPF